MISATTLNVTLRIFSRPLVPNEYRISSNLSSLTATVVSNSTSGTVRIPFSVTVDRDTYGAGFLETPPTSGFIVVQLIDPGFTFSNGMAIARYQSLDEVEVVNDGVRGVAYVVRNEVVYDYSLSSPVTAPMRVDFVINAFVQGPRGLIQESHVPFLIGNFVEFIPPGKDLIMLKLIM